jgi:hypothetical protein
MLAVCKRMGVKGPFAGASGSDEDAPEAVVNGREAPMD